MANDKSYYLFELASCATSLRMNPTFMNIGNDFNIQYYQKGTAKNFEKYFERTIIPPTKGCSTYLIFNINGKEGAYGLW